MAALLFPFLIGFFAGLRSLTAPAAAAWAARLGRLKLEGPLALIGSLPAVAILTLLAAAELVADKLPRTPNRTGAAGLTARVLTGALAGACVAAGHAQGLFSGALFGAGGAVAGAFAGHQARGRMVRGLGARDIYVALVEDVVAIAGSLWAVSRF